MAETLQGQMLQERELKLLFDMANQRGSAYLDNIIDRNVYPDQEALINLDEFDESLPDSGTPATEVIQTLDEFGSPTTVANQGGRYFGFVNGSSLPVSLAARLLGDYWDQNAGLYVISPIAAKLETICEQWLKELLGLPENVVAGFVSGTSVATFCGLAAGRYRLLERLGWNVTTQGLYDAPRLRVIACDQIHGTVLKAISLLGLGHEQIEWVASDDQGRILLDQMPELDDHCILILQAGNVCSGCYEDFESILPIARKAGAWVHVDGAFGLWAAGSDNFAHLTKGMEQANSFSVDGHKTLNLPYDNGLVLCDDAEALTAALHNAGSYVVLSDERDGMFYGPEMSRRARAIELWAALKYLGRDGVDELITSLHNKALALAQHLAEDGFEVLNDVVFNQVIVACESDEITLATMKNMQQSGECWLGGAHWKGREVIRVSVCSWVTTDVDIQRTIDAFMIGRAAARAEE